MLDTPVTGAENGQVDVREQDYTIEVTVSSDYCQAYVTIHSGKSIPCLHENEILEALAAKKVSYGIDQDAIKKMVLKPHDADHVLVAQGIPLRNGEDGVVKCHVKQIKNAKPKMMKDGRVDFKNMQTFHFVQEGDILAERTVATDGIDGMSVTGREIKAKPGKMPAFNAGKNTHLSEDGLQLIASTSGIVSFTGEQLEIIEVLVIHGDVGVETGNINFQGKVVVHGNVTSGYEIVSEESIEVNGIVESAILKSKGDVYIRNGVQGKDAAYIECDGDLHSGFLNNCHVRVKGKIEVDSILHCHIHCDDCVIAKGKKGQLIGGTLQVKRGIEAKAIGSEMGTITRLNLGVDSEILEKYQDVLKAVQEHKEALQKLDHAIELLRKQIESHPENDHLEELFHKTQDSKKCYDTKLVALKQQLKTLNAFIKSLRGATVCAETLHPGVKVKIGHVNYKVMQMQLGVQLKVNENEMITCASK